MPFIAKVRSSHLGIEPRTFGLEVQRAILCANGTVSTKLRVILYEIKVNIALCCNTAINISSCNLGKYFKKSP